MGNSFKAQGQLEDATAAYNKALAIEPDHAKAHNNMGLIFQQQKKSSRKHLQLTIKHLLVEI